MILKAFSEHLKTIDKEIPPVIVLSRWLKLKLSKNPENNIEKIIHSEIAFLKNKKGLFILVGKSNTGQILIESLYNFALSFEQQSFSKWINKVKASDFPEN